MPLPALLLGTLIIIVVVWLFVWPKIKNSFRVDKISRDLASDGTIDETSAIIRDRKETEKALKQKTKEADSAIKDAEKEKVSIKDAL